MQLIKTHITTMKNLITSFITLLLAGTTLHSQSVKVLYQKWITEDVIYDVYKSALTLDSGLIMLGRQTEIDSDGKKTIINGTLAKLDKNLDIEWTKTVSASFENFESSISGYQLFGIQKLSAGVGKNAYCLMKIQLNVDGEITQRDSFLLPSPLRFNKDSKWECPKLISTNKEIIMTHKLDAYNLSTKQKEQSTEIFALDQNGELLYHFEANKHLKQDIGGPLSRQIQDKKWLVINNFEGTEIQRLYSIYYDLVGVNKKPQDDIGHIDIQVFDKDFNIDSQFVFDGNGNDEIVGLLQLKSGNTMAFGASSSNDGFLAGNHGLLDGWVLLLDSGGRLLNTTCIGDKKNNFISSLVPFGQHYCALVTNFGTSSSSREPRTYSIYKLDSFGNEIWHRELNEMPEDVHLPTLCPAISGTIFLTARNFNYQSNDIWVAELEIKD
jgi:hypothetical protein